MTKVFLTAKVGGSGKLSCFVIGVLAHRQAELVRNTIVANAKRRHASYQFCHIIFNGHTAFAQSYSLLPLW